MYIIGVIPISRSIGSDTLSYFTNKEVTLGAIVDIPLRSKTVHGIVVSVKKADEMKSEIKSAHFALKKIDKIKGVNFFTKAFMEMVVETAEYYSASIGSVMNILIPKYILENINKLKKTERVEDGVSMKTDNIREKYAVQGDEDERFITWKGLIRQEFAKKKSLFFITPTIERAEHIFQTFEKGIEGYTFLLHGLLSTKDIIEIWNKIITEKHPVVIIATSSFLSIPRDDIETLIVEDENSKVYKIPRKPFLDIRNVCEIFAKKMGIKIFFADNLLRMETLWRENEGEIIQSSPFKFRSLSTATDLLVDMKKYKNNDNNFRILSDEVFDLILKNKEQSEHMIILTTRRGISPTTICNDCQNIVICNNCSAPVILHNTGEKNFFMCHRCGERRSAQEYCKTCGSWKLEAIGIGIDLVIQKIKEKFPDINIFKIDSDTIINTKTAKSIIQKFKSKPGSILIGTEMIFHYLHDKIENAAIVSLDSLFALPDFRIQEKIMYLLSMIRTRSTKHFIVQTRKYDEKIFEYGLKGNIKDFYLNEIDIRKKFNYPPFTTLIKITLEGKKEKIIEEMRTVQESLDPFEIEIFPAFTHTVKGQYILHGLIRLIKNKWPNQDLDDRLRALPLSANIKVDPETLL